MTMPEPTEQDIERIEAMTKKGFDLKARLRGRGLRRATIVLFLDEELGAELGDDKPITNSLGVEVGHNRTGVIGKIAELNDELQALEGANDAEMPASERKTHAANVKRIKKEIETLTEQRDALIETLSSTGLTVKLRAVPPIIQKDAHRKAKQTCGIETKGVPEDMKVEVSEAEVAHLLTSLVQSITDNESGETNEGMDYGEAVEFIDYLPPGQWFRLDALIGELQFTDAISRTIESQEDFS